MGCFFGCFRFGRDGSAPPSDHASRSTFGSKSLTPTAPEPVASRNRSPLSSLFVSEENDEEKSNLQSKEVEKQGCGTPELEFDVKELKDQAKFLKACGTIPETPIEIRKLSEKCKDLSTHNGEVDPLKFHSWLLNSSIEKQNLVSQPDQSPKPTKDCEDWVKESDSPVHTPSSCMTFEEKSNSPTVTSASPTTVPPSTTCRQRSVRFDCKTDMYSTLSKSSFEVDSPNSKASPYPTPLKLTDEMQTPGTVFPTHVDNLANGRFPRIRSQYVYSILNPIESASQLKEVINEDSESNQDSNSKLLFSDMGESVEPSSEANATSEIGLRETSTENNLNVEASLSSWLKPSLRQSSTQPFGRSIHHGKTLGDRPILGMVAAHWNENETSHVSPKWWDGNGIPNSTHKYKEDQKVSWHATPFEERLEKALSEESLVSQRKRMSGSPISFNETEESDTALSQLHNGNQSHHS